MQVVSHNAFMCVGFCVHCMRKMPFKRNELVQAAGPGMDTQMECLIHLEAPAMYAQKSGDPTNVDASCQTSCHPM